MISMFQTPELDIATELSDLLFTDVDCSPIQTPYIWKKFRRDSNNNRENCLSCNPKGSLIIEGQHSCPYCYGVGYIYDEVLFSGYMYQKDTSRDFTNLHQFKTSGKSDTTRFILVTDKNTTINLEDGVKVVRLNSDGKIHIPITITNTYKCLYTRYFKASNKNADFNIALLGG